MWAVIVVGLLVCVNAGSELPVARLGYGYVLLIAITLGLGSRIIVKIPRIRGEISVSDTFILLAILLFGGEAAVLLAGADALCSSVRITKKKLVIAFNTAVFICSTALTAWVLHLFFGSMVVLTQDGYSSTYITAICLMGVTQYVANSSLVATGVAFKAGQPVWKMWRENFLWTSLTYFAGASAAGIIAKLIGALGLYALLATAPIIAIVYFTYTTYLKNVEAAALQTELAQKHVIELSRHIAEQERTSRALRESEEHFRTAFDHAVGMALVAPNGRWFQVNDSLCQMLGYLEDELTVINFQSITHPTDLGESLANIYRLLEGKSANYQMEKRYKHKLGHSIWVLQSASLVRDADGKPQHLIFQIQDVSARKRAEEQIHHAAFHDALTGLPNRTLLADRLSMAVERAKRAASYKFAVLFLDLDRFKVVNDSLGHEMGDHLLVELSRRLEACIRKVDTVARLGGDEFAVLLDGIDALDDPVDIAKRIQEALKQPFQLEGHEFVTSGSIGIAYSSHGYERPEDILRDADMAMYRAKANGKARHEIFDANMHTRAVEALRLETELRHAIDRGEIQAHYQPIVSLETKTIVGFEALARWQHPQRGIVSTADFISLAEETGLIEPLGIGILRQACCQLREWQKTYPMEPPLTVSVNLSSRQFKQANLVDVIKCTLAEAELDPACLRLEITESILMSEAVVAIEMLKQLKSIGVQLSIDDFGTGYSSLSYLHRFPFDILKIDRSFVTRMSSDKESRSIVKTIVTLAAELGKAAVAEGVETEDHREALVELSCEYGQGYLFSKPVAPVEAEELLRAEAARRSRVAFEAVPAEQSEIETAHTTYAM